MFIELLVCPTPSLSVISRVSRPRSRPRPGVLRAEGVDFAPPSLHAKSRSLGGPGRVGSGRSRGSPGPAAARGASAGSENVDPRAPGRCSAPRRGPIESPFVLAKWGGRRGGRRCVAHVAHAPACAARDVGEPTDTPPGTSDRRVSSGGTSSSRRRRTAAWQLPEQSKMRRRRSSGSRVAVGPASRLLGGCGV